MTSLQHFGDEPITTSNRRTGRRSPSCNPARLLSKPVSDSPAPEPVGPASHPFPSNAGPPLEGSSPLDRPIVDPLIRDPVRSPHRSAASLHPLCLADQRHCSNSKIKVRPYHIAPCHMTAPQVGLRCPAPRPRPVSRPAPLSPHWAHSLITVRTDQKVRSRCLVCLLPPATPRADLLLLPSPAASLHRSLYVSANDAPPPSTSAHTAPGSRDRVRRSSLEPNPTLGTATDSRNCYRFPRSLSSHRGAKLPLPTRSQEKAESCQTS